MALKLEFILHNFSQIQEEEKASEFSFTFIKATSTFSVWRNCDKIVTGDMISIIRLVALINFSCESFYVVYLWIFAEVLVHFSELCHQTINCPVHNLKPIVVWLSSDGVQLFVSEHWVFHQFLYIYIFLFSFGTSREDWYLRCAQGPQDVGNILGIGPK